MNSPLWKTLALFFLCILPLGAIASSDTVAWEVENTYAIDNETEDKLVLVDERVLRVAGESGSFYWDEDASKWVALTGGPTNSEGKAVATEDGFYWIEREGAVTRWELLENTLTAQTLPPLPEAIDQIEADLCKEWLFVTAYDAAGKLVFFRLHTTADTQEWLPADLPPDAANTTGNLVTRHDEVSREKVIYWMSTANAGDYYANVSADGSLKWNLRDARPKDFHVNLAMPLGPAHLWCHVTYTDSGANALWLYHQYTDTWVRLVEQSTLTAQLSGVTRDKELYLIDKEGTGERFIEATLSSKPVAFSTWDYVTLVVYMTLLVGIGYRFSKAEKSTDEFFLGSRKVPWWAAGISIYATGISAISFMAIPAKTYASNWLYISLGIFPVISTYIAAYAFIPLLRKLEITTNTEYLQLRFGRIVRTVGLLLGVLSQLIGRLSITLLLPSLALTTVTGWDVHTCILLMGVLATLYTVLGGINAVIWTDVVQFFIMMGGAILALVIISNSLEGGFAEIINTGQEFGKFHSFDLSWDFAIPTLWVFTLWGIGDVFTRMTQESLQRVFSTSGVRDARRSLLMAAWISIPGTLVFYFIGSSLFAYYHAHSEELNPLLANDTVFPLFIATNMPVGIAGLIIAGLFAAAMSTMDSGMNSIATLVVKDFYSAFRKNSNDSERLIVAKCVTVFSGIVGTGFALWMANSRLGSIWDLYGEILSLIGGGFGGVMILGLLTRRATEPGTIIGVLIGSVSLYFIKMETTLIYFTYGVLASLIAVAVGYVASLLLPSQEKDLEGLTIHTKSKGE